jgi:hypothetical protein
VSMGGGDIYRIVPQLLQALADSPPSGQ